MSRLIYELLISPMKALHSGGLESQGPIVQGPSVLGLLIAD